MNDLVASTVSPPAASAWWVCIVPQDPGAHGRSWRKTGKIAFDFGAFWLKGQQMGTGQANVKAYNRRLMS